MQSKVALIHEKEKPVSNFETGFKIILFKRN